MLYEKLDAQIMEMLSENPSPVFDIWLRFRDQVRNINVIDRRMQSLKKKGLVCNIKGAGWAEVKRG